MPQADAQRTFLWEPAADYADTFNHKGYAYKTIRFPNFFIMVAVMRTESIGGSRLSPDYFTTAELMMQNDGEKKIDFLGSRCVCLGTKKEKVLEFGMPKVARQEPRFMEMLARAPHTLLPGYDLKGQLWFRGRCKKGLLVEITVQGKCSSSRSRNPTPRGNTTPMLNAYINYPNPRVTLHRDVQCGQIQKMYKPSRRVVLLRPASLSAELNNFVTKYYRFAASAAHNDIWLDVDFNDPVFEEAIVAHVQRLIGRNYAPLAKASIERHC